MTATLWQSTMVAAIFAIHPLHVESVAWIAERRDVLYAFFMLLTIRTFINYVEKPTKRRHLWVLLCFIFAAMSKPMVVTLPFILLLLDYWPLGRLRIPNQDRGSNPFTAPSLQAIRQKVPILHLFVEKLSLFSIAAVISLFTLFSSWEAKALSSLKALPLIVRSENAVVSYGEYILKTIWPNPLAVLYPHPMALPVSKIVSATLLLLTITILVILGRKKHPYLIVGWLWYLITLLPVIGLIQSGIQSMADRFMYMPMTGLLIMVIYGISDIYKNWPYKRLTLTVLSVLLLSTLMASTRAQVKLWQNSETLFRHTLQVTKNNYLIHNNLAAALVKQGKDQEAFVQIMRALEINPRYADAQYNLGSLLLKQGKDREAIPHFIAALQIKPDYVQAHNDLGIILNRHGKSKEAMDHLSKAIQFDPTCEEAYFNKGHILLQQKNYVEAIFYFKEVLRINPNNSKAYNALGVSFLDSGSAEKAMDCYHKALEINPNDADTHVNLGGLLIQQGKYEEAILHLTEALRINPDDGEVHFTLGMLYLKINQKELALKQYTILMTIDNKMASTLYRNISTHRN